MEIGAFFAQIIPIFDYFITYLTNLITALAASVGIDLDALYNENA